MPYWKFLIWLDTSNWFLPSIRKVNEALFVSMTWEHTEHHVPPIISAPNSMKMRLNETQYLVERNLWPRREIKQGWNRRNKFIIRWLNEIGFITKTESLYVHIFSFFMYKGVVERCRFEQKCIPPFRPNSDVFIRFVKVDLLENI